MKKLFILWIAVLIIAFGGWIYLRMQQKAIILPLPKTITSATIEQGISTEKMEFIIKNNQWTVMDQAAPKFGKFVDALKDACFQQEPISKINDPEGETPLKLIFNDKDTWIIGRHNKFSKSNYMIHGDTAYICSEQLQIILAMPISYWMASDA